MQYLKFLYSERCRAVVRNVQLFAYLLIILAYHILYFHFNIPKNWQGFSAGFFLTKSGELSCFFLVIVQNYIVVKPVSCYSHLKRLKFQKILPSTSKILFFFYHEWESCRDSLYLGQGTMHCADVKRA